MEIVQVVIIGLLATILIITFRKHSPEISFYIEIAVVIVVFFLIIDKIAIILELIKKITVLIDINDIYIKILIQILGIALISELGAKLCEDAGQRAIATKIELTGKVMIMIVSIPVLMAIINMINSILI